MSEYVVIRLAAEDQPVQWVSVDSNGTRRSGLASGSLEQAAVAIGTRPVIVLVPPLDVMTTSVKLPIRSITKIRAALPFALEELLADDISKLHFAVGAREADNQFRVAVVNDERLSAWIERLRAADIEPEIITPENYGLARIPGTLSMIIDDAVILFDDGADSAFAMQDVKPSDVLVVAGALGEQSESETEKSGHLQVYCTAEKEQDLTHDWIALRHELHSVDINVLPDGVLPKLAVTVAAGNGVNLLQGKYGKKAEYSSWLRPWKTAAALLLGLMIVGLSGKGIEYYQLTQQEAALRAQFAAEYQQLRPGDTREIVDPLGIVESLKRSLGGVAVPQVFLPGLRELGSALTNSSGADIEAISYRAGVIDLRLTAPDVATLDKIQKAVSASGRFQASIQSTDQVGDRINGRIQIRESGL